MTTHNEQIKDECICGLRNSEIEKAFEETRRQVIHSSFSWIKTLKNMVYAPKERD